MNIKFILLLIAPIFAFGASSGSGEYDIVPRVINFVIFFSILYYLIAKPIKAAYNARINSIANRLNAIQEKLKASNAKREEAAKRVENAKVMASELSEAIKKEIEIMLAKIEKDTQNEIHILEKSYEEQKEFEERKLVRAVVSEVLDELFASEAIKIDQNELVNLIIKKVS
ncbi:MULTISPECIES: F0F1 ATP synthase subunit B [Campylobacter]|uniref:ATP synthase subunit b n=1 Tax=Campylobacter porcelli TaxID=1660073 RepID=A0A1X9SXU6_9BACT|nr:MULTISPECIES: F0F1 ATP synthase subunit B [unclassified Campylobacter]ARR01104.1 ATP synthase, F0 complex, b subunit [Campylobacter sp. RM6137]MCR8679365.1 F0F1 ATP synthase subunit B [Campylobacter sp. RM19072]MCR8696529.1 F0F1 ATP synthase subunit B [Campylobacter sp. RM19073]MEE3744911.1 F0F1 ATP synthase subunit B [Campylobacter sp. CX2-4855-23]